MKTNLVIPYRCKSWHGLVHRDWAAYFLHSNPMAWMTSLPHEQTRHRVSRQIYRVQTFRGPVYVKVMLGLNERSMQQNPGWIDGLVDKLKWRLRPSRAVQTLRVSQAMLASGLHCPEPILAARENTAGLSRDVFISQAVELPGLGVRLKQETDPARRITMVQAVAPHIALLHRKRFLHGDLLPNNLHVNESLDCIWFMDNDRTRRWPCPLPGWAVRRNLAQQSYRLLVNQDEPLARAFLQAYGVSAGWREKRIAQTIARVMRTVHKREEKTRSSRKQPPAGASPTIS